MKQRDNPKDMMYMIGGNGVAKEEREPYDYVVKSGNILLLQEMILVSEFLLLCNFFIGLIILIVELAIISDLQDLRADLYYYSEQKSDFDD